MIELTLQAIDRVISLLRGRIDDKRRFVQEQVDPIFKDMEIIHQNYIQSFTDIIQAAEEANNNQDLIGLVLNKKMEFEHVRVKTYSIAKVARTSDRVPEPAKEFFEQCFMYFRRQNDVFSIDKYSSRFSGMLEILSGIDQGSDISKSRQLLIDYFDGCLDYTRKSWERFTQEYGKCKLEMLR